MSSVKFNDIEENEPDSGGTGFTDSNNKEVSFFSKMSKKIALLISTIRRAKARIDLDSIHFYNVEEAHDSLRLKITKSSLKDSRELIRNEMKRKLLAGNFSEDLIKNAIEVVDNIFR